MLSPRRSHGCSDLWHLCVELPPGRADAREGETACVCGEPAQVSIFMQDATLANVRVGPAMDGSSSEGPPPGSAEEPFMSLASARGGRPTRTARSP